jgi:catechol 2,3-dioxygenase-like lactoylglutathione lyase family enzyme
VPERGPGQVAERAEPIMPSRDLDETRTFFRQLGFTAWFGPHSAWSYEILSRGTLVLHFFLDRELDISKNGSGCYWRVADADRLHGEFSGHSLPAAGIPRMTAPRNENWGMREFAIVDPSGNLMRIGHALR